MDHPCPDGKLVESAETWSEKGHPETGSERSREQLRS